MELLSPQGDVLADGKLSYEATQTNRLFSDNAVACGDRLAILRAARGDVLQRVDGDFIDVLLYDRQLRVVEVYHVDQVDQSRQVNATLHCVGGQLLVCSEFVSATSGKRTCAIRSLKTGFTTTIEIGDFESRVFVEHDRLLVTVYNSIWCLAPSGRLLWSGAAVGDSCKRSIFSVAHDASGIYLFYLPPINPETQQPEQFVEVARLSSDTLDKGSPFTNTVREVQFQFVTSRTKRPRN
eukprot:TRINITY_DN816_c0_g3_i5.p1 TRINITY_DN816_c0_g3~~TRINITY_DN816_c0_g3_i5.p1  ORF type:complete len:238 (+),score=24.70 TRINITY_DN816_c0_g3_i5:143-856(+)